VAARQAAQTLGLQVLEVHVRTVDDVASAFASAIEWEADGLLVMPSPAYVGPVEIRIAELAAWHRLPAAYTFRHYVESGGLMSCGANQPAAFRRVATDVDRILRGVRPGEMPIEQAATLDLVVNLRAAQAPGLTIPTHAAAQVTEAPNQQTYQWRDHASSSSGSTSRLPKLSASPFLRMSRHR
jgi:putative ABC transport system substrate-binding protein